MDIFEKLRFWEVDRQLGMDYITEADKQANPFIGVVFKIRRGKCKGLLFLIDGLKIDPENGSIAQIMYTGLNAQNFYDVGVTSKEVVDAVSRVVRELLRSSYKNALKQGLITQEKKLNE